MASLMISISWLVGCSSSSISCGILYGKRRGRFPREFICIYISERVRGRDLVGFHIPTCHVLLAGSLLLGSTWLAWLGPWHDEING